MEWRCSCCRQYQIYLWHRLAMNWRWHMCLCRNIKWHHHVINKGSKTCNIWKNIHCLKLGVWGTNGSPGQRWEGTWGHDKGSWTYFIRNVKQKIALQFIVAVKIIKHCLSHFKNQHVVRLDLLGESNLVVSKSSKNKCVVELKGHLY
jgi:hypothetical protein